MIKMSSRRAMIAAAAGTLCCLTAGPVRATVTPIVGSGSVLPPPQAAPLVSPSPYTPHRPASCPRPLPDPNTPSPGQPASATGTFPWPPLGTNSDPETAARFGHTPVQSPPLRPANWDQGNDNWKLTSARASDPRLSANPQELCGVEGNSVDQAWQLTTGSPDTVIAVTDSGIEWCDPGIVNKLYLNRAALPPPENSSGLTKPQLEARGMRFADTDPYDLDGSGVLNVTQYSQDPRVAEVARDYGGLFCADHGGAQFGSRRSYTGISPADLIRTFGTPSLPNGQPNPYYYGHQGPAGFTEAISGWNFVDDNNNPYDDVHYDHGTGEAQDSSGVASSLEHQVGSCPDCMILPVRVGDSFIATANAFAEGVLFAVDSGASVVQEALGTIDDTSTAQQAIDYAAAHGVPVVASAADEHAEHHNEPANLEHTIVVNSVTEAPSQNGVPEYQPPSYLYFNSCTNYGANIAVSVESDACSSNATGIGAGITGLIESEAEARMLEGHLAPYPGLLNANGLPVPLSANEVRQLLTMSASSVDFGKAAPPIGPPDNYAVVAPVPTTRFPTHPGFTPYFGYGRTDAAAAVSWVARGWIPPQAEITGLPWFETLPPTGQLTVSGLVGTPRSCPGEGPDGSPCRWHAQVQVAVGAGPEPGSWHTMATRSGEGVYRGVLAHIALGQVASLFPPSIRFSGFDGGPVGIDGRPDPNRFTFTVRVVVVDSGPVPLIGIARRAEFLHSAAGLVFGQPMRFGGSIDTSPTLAPLGPGGSNVLLVATSNGTVHALLPDGRELPGWPVHTAVDTGYHPGEPAYRSGKVAVPRGELIDVSGGLAVGDLSDASAPCLKESPPNGSCLDVVATDYTGRVYAWNAGGKLLPGFPVRTDAAFSGPGVAGTDNRVLRGFFSAPALAPLQGSFARQGSTVTPLDIVAASMDRHVYAWQPNGRPLPGWPVLVVDPSEVASINPTTGKVAFKASSNVLQGTKLMDTPAIGNLAGGSGAPDVIVGSNEQYGGPMAASLASPINFTLGELGNLAGLFGTGNSRVYAISPEGTDQPAPPSRSYPPGWPDRGAILPGWPAPVGEVDAGILPDVGNGVTNSPALADLAGKGQLDVGVLGVDGPAYLLTPSGSSYLGTGPDGQPKVLSTEPAGLLSNSVAGIPSVPALGAPAFAPLGPAAPGTSLVAPAISLAEALNEAFPGDHPVHDSQIDAWSTQSGRFDLGFPQVINDLPFFDQPIVADVGGAGAGPYVVMGSATYDLRAVNALGQEASGFPKFTGGWIVNGATFGPFGTLGTQVLAAGTREGFLFVWSTTTPACAPGGPWPMAHHDLWNTNDLDTPGVTIPACRAVPTAIPTEGAR